MNPPPARMRRTARSRAERANYFDAGISQKISKHLQVGVDGYYKNAKQQLDDGLFGQTLILSAFNYARGRIYGVEFTGSYNQGGFSSYANLAWSQAQGENWSSAQFLFDPDRCRLRPRTTGFIWTTTSASPARSAWPTPGMKGTTPPRAFMPTRFMAAVCGPTQRSGGMTIPNGASVPQYYSDQPRRGAKLQVWRNKMLKARFDVVNVTDNIYQLRDGSGVGVNAASIRRTARLLRFGQPRVLKNSSDEQHGCKSNIIRLRVERRAGAVVPVHGPAASRSANSPG